VISILVEGSTSFEPELDTTKTGVNREKVDGWLWETALSAKVLTTLSDTDIIDAAIGVGTIGTHP
jgi:hypothetical protein